jgi:outer membrane protein
MGTRTVAYALAVMFLAGCAVAPPVGAKDFKIGYIDVPRILEEYQGFKDAQSDLEKARKSREEEFGRRYEDLQKLQRELLGQDKMLTDAKKKAKAEELRKKSSELEEWRVTQSKELQERQEGLVKRLEADVRKVLEKVCESDGFSFVVRRDLLLYMDRNSVDLTDRVLAELRKQAPKPKEPEQEKKAE